MAKGDTRSDDRQVKRQGPRPAARRTLIRRPMNWPRYMVQRVLSDGSVAYYWNPITTDTKAGFTLGREALGKDYAAAIARAEQLNLHLDAWRAGRGETKDIDHRPDF